MKPAFFATINGRRPQNVRKVVPSELIVLKLRDRVSQKDKNSKNVECLNELTLTITCLKNYSFNETSCEKEIKDMQQCFQDFAKGTKTPQVPGKQLPPKVAKKLLDRYPNI